MILDVIIPVYNANNYLHQLFEDLRMQTMQDYNIYIVDDCSTDNSLEIIEKEICNWGNRLYLLKNDKNEGPAIARNIALDNRKEVSQFVMFIDADDRFEQDYFMRMVDKALNTEVDMVICGIDRRNEEGKVLCKEMLNNPEGIITDIKNCNTLGYMIPVLWNKLFRSSCIGEHRFFDSARSEDTIFIYEILPNIKSIVFINEILYHYIIRKSSMTGDYTEKMHNTMLDGFKELKTKYKDGKQYDDFMELLELQMFIRCGVGGTYRLAFKDMGKSFYYEKSTRDYLDKEFPNWRKNKFLSLREFKDKTIKQNAISVCAGLYKCHLFSVFIVLYWIVSKILKKDIRF